MLGRAIGTTPRLDAGRGPGLDADERVRPARRRLPGGSQPPPEPLADRGKRPLERLLRVARLREAASHAVLRPSAEWPCPRMIPGELDGPPAPGIYSRPIEDSVRILLFDIDGTLVSTGGAGAVAWKQAFDELYGIPADIGEFTDAGMTDPDVGAKTFEAVLRREPTPRELAQLIQRRLEHLPEAVAQSEGYRVLPGVPERLRQLSRDGHLLGHHHRQRRRRRVREARARRPHPLVHLRRLRDRGRRPRRHRAPGGRARRGDARRATCRTRTST